MHQINSTTRTKSSSGIRRTESEPLSFKPKRNAITASISIIDDFGNNWNEIAKDLGGIKRSKSEPTLTSKTKIGLSGSMLAVMKGLKGDVHALSNSTSDSIDQRTTAVDLTPKNIRTIKENYNKDANLRQMFHLKDDGTLVLKKTSSKKNILSSKKESFTAKQVKDGLNSLLLGLDRGDVKATKARLLKDLNFAVPNTNDEKNCAAELRNMGFITKNGSRVRTLHSYKETILKFDKHKSKIESDIDKKQVLNSIGVIIPENCEPMTTIFANMKQEDMHTALMETGLLNTKGEAVVGSVEGDVIKFSDRDDAHLEMSFCKLCDGEFKVNYKLLHQENSELKKQFETFKTEYGKLREKTANRPFNPKNSTVNANQKLKIKQINKADILATAATGLSVAVTNSIAKEVTGGVVNTAATALGVGATTAGAAVVGVAGVLGLVPGMMKLSQLSTDKVPLSFQKEILQEKSNMIDDFIDVMLENTNTKIDEWNKNHESEQPLLSCSADDLENRYDEIAARVSSDPSLKPLLKEIGECRILKMESENINTERKILEQELKNIKSQQIAVGSMMGIGVVSTVIGIGAVASLAFPPAALGFALGLCIGGVITGTLQANSSNNNAVELQTQLTTNKQNLAKFSTSLNTTLIQ